MLQSISTESHRTLALSETYPHHHSKQETKIQTFKVMLISTNCSKKMELVMTGQEKAPVEISCGGMVIQRRAISITHIEADNNIMQQDIKL